MFTLFQSRTITAAILAASTLAAASFGQTKPAEPSAIGSAVSKEVKGLTSDDFPERQAALAHLKTLVADQLKQRAQIQDVLLALQTDLAKQQQALAMVSNDEEAQAQISGLLEMERGLAGWTMQTMSEPLEKRTGTAELGPHQRTCRRSGPEFCPKQTHPHPGREGNREVGG